MKKILFWSVPIKSLAAMIFAGFIIIYMIARSLYALIAGGNHEYVIPFAFAIHSAVLSVVIAVLCALIFSEGIIKKMRYYKRVAIFIAVLTPLLVVHTWLFFSLMWVIVAGAVGIGVIVGMVIVDRYFKLLGRQYTDVLESYKAKLV